MQPASNEQFAAFRQGVLRPLERLGSRMKTHVLIEGLCLCAGVLVFAGLLQFALDWLLALGVGPRAALLIAIVSLVGYQLYRRVVRPLRVRIDAGDVAAVLERKRPEYHDRLVTAVAFATGNALNPLRDSPALVRAILDDSIQRFSNIPTAGVLNQRRYIQRLVVGGAAMLVVLGAAAAAPGMFRVYLQRNWQMKDTAWPVSSEIIADGFESGRLRWPVGDDLRILARAVKGAPSGLAAEFEFASGETVVRDMDRLGESQFVLDYGPLVQTMRMRFVIARIGVDERTDWYDIDAVSRPAVRAVRIEIAPPGYARQSAYELPSGSATADVLRRSRVAIEADMSKPVKKATLRYRADDREEASVEIRQGMNLLTSFEPARSGAYYFDVEDHDGLDDRSPVTYTFNLLTDPPPRVRLTMPGVGEMVVPNAQLPLTIECDDNLGIESIELRHEVKRQSPTSTDTGGIVSDSLPGFVLYQQRFTSVHLFPLLPLSVKPGDQLVLQVRAKDGQPVDTVAPDSHEATENAAASGLSPAPAVNVGESAAYTLRIVTPEELQAELGRRENEWRREFEQIIKAQEQLNRRVLDLRSADPVESLSAEQSARYGQEARAQRQQISRLKTVLRQFEQIYAEIKVNQLATSQVRRRLEGGVISPMRGLSVDELPRAAESLESLRTTFTTSNAEAVEELQVRIVRAMYAILADMMKWEGYNEAVALLRDIVRLQSDVNQDTQARLDRELERLFGGNEESPTSRPAREGTP